PEVYKSLLLKGIIGSEGKESSVLIGTEIYYKGDVVEGNEIIEINKEIKDLKDGKDHKYRRIKLLNEVYEKIRNLKTKNPKIFRIPENKEYYNELQFIYGAFVLDYIRNYNFKDIENLFIDLDDPNEPDKNYINNWREIFYNFANQYSNMRYKEKENISEKLFNCFASEHSNNIENTYKAIINGTYMRQKMILTPALVRVNNNETMIDIMSLNKASMYSNMDKDILYTDLAARSLVDQFRYLYKVEGGEQENIFFAQGGSSFLFNPVFEKYFKQSKRVMMPNQYGPLTDSVRGDGEKFIVLEMRDYNDDLLKLYRKSIEEHNPDWVVIVNPGNPFGKYVPYTKLVEFIEEYNEKNYKKNLHKKIVNFYIDDAYAEFHEIYNKVSPNEIGMNYFNKLIHSGNAIISRTLSKSYSRPGIRLGYLIGNEKLIKPLRRNEREDFIPLNAENYGMICFNSEVNAEIHEMMRKDFIDKMLAHKSKYKIALERLNKKYQTSYKRVEDPLVPFISIDIGDTNVKYAVATLLLENGILTMPYGNLLRISYLDFKHPISKEDLVRIFPSELNKILNEYVYEKVIELLEEVALKKLTD
ncbi:MAG: aminotransferase class I/II-fold pyridoxal phosphate-dependent enzyme, partial [Candidatus Margulisbacteria bacterium]|nr:aminotransferase class I/II-fold pyridoxal phosphate-dependent enzyme [Candidatus Margulisiibacteriota bacterium]